MLHFSIEYFFFILLFTIPCAWIVSQLIAEYLQFLKKPFQQIQKRVLQLWRGDIQADPRDVSKRRRNHGSVYVTHLGSKPIVVLAGRDPCFEFYSNVKTVVRNRALDLGDLFDRFIGDCLGALSGARWPVVKRAFQSAMLKMQSEQSIKIMHTEITRWQREVLDPLAENRSKVDALALVADMPQRVVQAIFFGRQFVDRHDATLKKLAVMSKELITEVFFNRFAKSWLYRLLPTETNQTLGLFKQDLAHLLDQYDKQNEETRQQGVLYWVHRERITEEEFLQTIAEILFVNLDVSVPSTAWLLVHMALHADKVDVGYATTFSEDPDSIHVGQNTLDFVKESARIAPIGYLSISQLSDKEILGFPAGTSFAVDVISVNRDARVWASPEMFNPERFQKDTEGQDFGYMRFGMGTRKCPGRHIADSLFGTIVERCARRFDFQIVSNSIKCSDDVPLHSGYFIAPKCEISVSWKPILTRCQSFADSAIFSGVSITPTSPFRDQRKADALLLFLAKTGQPVTIILPDTLNRYNVMAFEGKSEKKATQISKQRGNELYNNLDNAWRSLLNEEGTFVRTMFEALGYR